MWNRCLLTLLYWVCPWAVAQASWQTWDTTPPSTHLIEITQATPLGSKARGLRNGGYESANGNWVGFDRWYAARWRDTRVSWLTQLNPHWGVIWGFSTGEKAPKYSLSPGLRLGFIAQHAFNQNAVLSLSVSTYVGSRLKERTCRADYGDIGGVQTVNCRLAATPLPPADTLQYLLNERPATEWSVHFKYRF